MSCLAFVTFDLSKFLANLDWHEYVIVLGGLWSIFWSFAPSPKPNTWYNAIFHVAQYISLNPGRSVAIAQKQAVNQNGTAKP